MTQPTSYHILADEQRLVELLGCLDYGDQISYTQVDQYDLEVFMPAQLRFLLTLRGELEKFEDLLYDLDHMKPVEWRDIL